MQGHQGENIKEKNHIIEIEKRDVALEDVAKKAIQICVESFGLLGGWLGRAESDGHVRLVAHFPDEASSLEQVAVRWDETELSHGVVGKAIKSGKLQICQDVEAYPSYLPWKGFVTELGIKSFVAIPLIENGRAFGSINLYSDKIGYFTDSIMTSLQNYVGIFSFILKYSNLYNSTNKRLNRLKALRNIDMAISAGNGIKLVYYVALEETIKQLGADAASILSYDPHAQSLKIAATHGFEAKNLEGLCVSIENTIEGKVLKKHEIIHIPDLRAISPFDSSSIDFYLEEGFRSYYGAPLTAKGERLGVLQVFFRNPLTGGEEWVNFFEALAGQISLGIDNAKLVDDLWNRNLELFNAYNETIAGWGKALSLKEDETADHSERVTKLTVEIARRMGIKNPDLVHIERGAYLHDIGKIGVPDSILLKKGKLTEEEWEIMKKHPEYAFEMLSPITYLNKSIDIPYCHHEKWDGTGYPRGLKGKQIPLSARIFAVVDVWDALTSDRPYRKAWPKEKAIEYIKEQKGKHFDPEVVDVFITIIEGQE